jgi:hypothetical protein
MLSNWDHDQSAEQVLFPEDITLCSNKTSPLGVPAVLARHRWVTVANVNTQYLRGGPDCSRSAVCRCNSFATHCSILVQEWDYGKNKAGPSEYISQSNEVVWWQTASRGSWQQRIDPHLCSWIKQCKAGKQAFGTICLFHMCSTCDFFVVISFYPCMDYAGKCQDVKAC